MKTIDTAKLEKRMGRDRDFVFLNVLPAETYAQEHIQGSENLPYNDPDFIGKAAQMIPSKDAEVVVYCASLECPASTKAAQKLEDAGYTNVTDYEGGMEAWKDAHHGMAA